MFRSKNGLNSATPYGGRLRISCSNTSTRDRYLRAQDAAAVASSRICVCLRSRLQRQTELMTSLALVLVLATHAWSQNLNNLSDLDAYVADKYASLSNAAVVYPAGSFRFPIDCGTLSFTSAGEIATLTNRFPVKPVLGVPVYPLKIVENHGIPRLWIYCDADDVPFRTNQVPVSFDAQTWVRLAYRHEAPSYLADLDLEQWYADRDRSRCYLNLALINESDFTVLQAAQQSAMNNPPVTESSQGPILPPDTNHLAFAGIQYTGNRMGLWLYTPATRPVAFFTRTDLAGPPAGWSYAGSLGAIPPFNFWQSSPDCGNAFFQSGFTDIDSDGDGLPDVMETLVTGTDPTRFDSVGGTLGDYARVLIYGLKPLAISTVGDGIPDEWKITHGINPHDPNAANQDSDGDGLTNLQEYQLGTNPTDANELLPGIPSVSGTISYSGILTGLIYVVAVTTSNSWLMDYSCCMTAPGAFLIRNLPASSYWIKAFRDVNGNGVRDSWEPMGIASGSALTVSSRISGVNISLGDPDSDGDGLSDYEELIVYFTDPNNADTDGDTLTDKDEILVNQTSPFSNDSDGDGILDADEILARSDPLLVDSDGDRIDDKTEKDTSGLNPNDAGDGAGDLDGDGFTNYIEYIDDWPMRTAASSNALARYAFIYRWPGANRIRVHAQGSSYNSCVVLGDAGSTSATVRIPPTKQIDATVNKRLYHTGTTGFFLNGAAMDSLSSPITIPDSSGTMVYRVSASPSAQGTTASVWLGDALGNTNTSALYLRVPKITTCRIQDGNANNYTDVAYGQTGALYVGWAPNLPCSARVVLDPSFGNIGDLAPIRDSEYPFASISGAVTNYSANLDWRDYRSARVYRRGLPLPVGHHHVGIGFDFNLDKTLQADEESLGCEVYVVKVDLGIKRNNGNVVPEEDEQTSGSIVQLTPKTNRAGLFLDLVGPTVEPADVRDQLTYKFVTSKPLYGGGAIRLYRNGVLYKDSNITQTNVASGDLSAVWTVDATVGGVVDLALVAYKPNGWEVTRDTVRINAIASTPTDGRIRYVYPASSMPTAPYTSLERGAHSISEVLQCMRPNDNILISPATIAYQEHRMIIPYGVLLAGLAGKWNVDDPATNTTPHADLFDYSNLPDIQPGSTNATPMFYFAGDSSVPLCLSGLRLRNGRSFSAPCEGGALYVCDMDSPVIATCVKFEGNKSSLYGGAVSMHNVANATFDTCYFNNNLCEYDDRGVADYTHGMGGAVAAFNSSLTATNCVFNGNIARVVHNGGRPALGSAGGGGDIYLQKGTLRLGKFRSQNAVAGFAMSPAVLRPEDSKTYFTGDGGSILIHGQKTDTTVDIRDSSIKSAQSFGNGGAISFSKDSSPDARTYFLVSVWPNPDSPTIPVEPKPDSLGGGCMGTIYNVLFSGVKGGWQGGTISANGRGMAIIIRDCVFDECQSGVTHLRDGKGGAVAVGGGLQDSGDPENDVLMSNCKIRSCSASGNGGGLYVTIRGQLQVEDTAISDCLALNAGQSATNDCRKIAGHGGGIHASAGGYVYLRSQGTNRVQILNCNAAVNGGGLSVKSGKAFVYGNTTIQGNAASGQAVDGFGNGGGIFVTTSYYDESETEIDVAKIAGRLAARLFDDHGYLFSGYSGNMLNVVSNQATRWGGGIYVGISNPWYGTVWPNNYAESKVTLADAAVKHNNAGKFALGALMKPAQFAAERVDDALTTLFLGGTIPLTAIPIPGSPKLDFIRTQFDGNPTIDIGIYYLDSIRPTRDAATGYGTLNPVYWIFEDTTP